MKKEYLKVDDMQDFLSRDCFRIKERLNASLPIVLPVRLTVKTCLHVDFQTFKKRVANHPKLLLKKKLAYEKRHHCKLFCILISLQFPDKCDSIGAGVATLRADFIAIQNPSNRLKGLSVSLLNVFK